MSRPWNALRDWWRAIDWRIALMLGPRHRFTDADWQRLQPVTRISPSVQFAALGNVLLLALLPLGQFGRVSPLVELVAVLCALLMGVGTLGVMAWVWRRPTMKRLYLAYGLSLPLGVLTGVLLALYKRKGGDFTPGLEALLVQQGLLLFVAALGVWITAMWRNEYYAQWLREQDRQAEALELARRLATAQIQPHFLFNSLASLQHWVQSRDERAAPLLASLTAYLRATLPLFDRSLLSVAEEAEAAQRYLEVMQARLGERLRFRLEIAPAAAGAQLPPGVLLTLVENAVEHGVQPRLSGGEIVIRAVLDAQGSLQLQVLDDGPGLPATFDEAGPRPEGGSPRGLGLRNTRLRLQQAFGERASLALREREPSGCAACVQVLAG